MCRLVHYSSLALFAFVALGVASCGEDDKGGDASSTEADGSGDDRGGSGDDITVDDNDDGSCWLDTDFGLRWMVEPFDEKLDWSDARQRCMTLDLCGRTQWRLPSISELRSLVKNCPDIEPDGRCIVTDSCFGSECTANEEYPTDCEFCDPRKDHWRARVAETCPLCEEAAEGECHMPEALSGPCEPHWSRNYSEDDSYGWLISFSQGAIWPDGKGWETWVRCVHSDE